MANGIYALGTKLAFTYPKTQEDGSIIMSPRTGFVVPPVRTQVQSNVVFLQTPEGTRSYSLPKMTDVQVLA